jgi:hypothetical protein
LNYFRQHGGSVRSRLAKKKQRNRETRKVQDLIVKRYGRRQLLQDCPQALPTYVTSMIEWVRKPPQNEVSLRQSLGLLAWFAHIHPRALAIGLRMLIWETMAKVGRTIGFPGLAGGKRSSSSDLL